MNASVCTSALINFAVMTKDHGEVIVPATHFVVDELGWLRFPDCKGVFREWLYVTPIGVPRELGTRTWDEK